MQEGFSLPVQVTITERDLASWPKSFSQGQGRSMQGKVLLLFGDCFMT